MILTLLLLLHGVVHLLGFVVPWQLAEPEGFPYKTTLLSGRLDVGPVGIRVVGVIWLLVALALVVAAIGTWTQQVVVGTGRDDRGDLPGPDGSELAGGSGGRGH
jgi:hypothetical protein